MALLSRSVKAAATPIRRSSRLAHSSGLCRTGDAGGVVVDEEAALSATASGKKRKIAAQAPKLQPPAVSKSKKMRAASSTEMASGAGLCAVEDASAAPSGISRFWEERYWKIGKHKVCGVDEAGRGPLCGPVVAGACILPRNLKIQGLDDSKKLSEVERERLYEEITTCSEIKWAVSVVENEEIDRINILQATMAAMRNAVKQVNDKTKVDHVVIDGNRVPSDLPSSCSAEFIIKGDGKSTAIAAASVLAKVTRDRIMMDHDKKWPHYGFAQHKGYGVATHMAAIHKHGPCAIHRRTFAPIKTLWPLPESGDTDTDGAGNKAKVTSKQVKCEPSKGTSKAQSKVIRGKAKVSVVRK